MRCSRSKLDAALAASKLSRKTQIALSEAVADAEGLDTVPKDLVNKMFRELPVDPQTVERVARVLEVKAYMLYLDSSGVAPSANPVAPASQPQHKTPPYWWQIGSIMLLLGGLLLTSALWNSQPKQPVECMQLRSPIAVHNDQLVVVIARLAGEPSNQTQLMLASILASDPRLKSHLQIYTSCFGAEFNSTEAFTSQIAHQHQRAREELKHYQANLMIWGEKYGDRVNLRFSSEQGAEKLHQLTFMGKPVVTSEQDFSMNVRLDDQSVINSDLQITLLNILSPEKNALISLKDELIASFNYTGSWLKEAVYSDRQLISRISAVSDPKLYLLTLVQLCYQQRLLADLESSSRHYQEAKTACQKALDITDKNQSPMQWAAIYGNLASIEVRLHLYAEERKKSLILLNSAVEKFKSIESIFNHHAMPTENSTFYQNFAAAYIRLAEFSPNKTEDYLTKALELNQKSIELSSQANNPLYTSQRLQNQCVIKYRLGGIKKQQAIIYSAIKDCEAAKQIISPAKHPNAYAMTENNLAISHAILAEVKSSPSLLRDALSYFDQAQRIYTKERFAVNWGQVELNKAELQCNLALMTKDQSLLDSAKVSAESAGLIFIENNVAAYQAYTENLLGKIAHCQQNILEECRCSE